MMDDGCVVIGMVGLDGVRLGRVTVVWVGGWV